MTNRIQIPVDIQIQKVLGTAGVQQALNTAIQNSGFGKVEQSAKLIAPFIELQKRLNKLKNTDIGLTPQFKESERAAASYFEKLDAKSKVAIRRQTTLSEAVDEVKNQTRDLDNLEKQAAQNKVNAERKITQAIEDKTKANERYVESVKRAKAEEINANTKDTINTNRKEAKENIGGILSREKDQKKEEKEKTRDDKKLNDTLNKEKAEYNRVLGKIESNTIRVAAATDKATISLRSFAEASALATKRFLAFLGPTSILFGIFSLARQGVDDALKFEATITKIQQTLGESTENARALGKEIRAISSSKGVNAQDLAQSVQVLSQAGFTDRKALLQTTKVLSNVPLAATFDDLPSTTEGLLAIFSQFNLTLSDTASILDTISQYSNDFAAESRDLFEIIKRSGSAFSALEGGGEEGFLKLIKLASILRSSTRESAETLGVFFKSGLTKLTTPESRRLLQNRGLEGADITETLERLGNFFNDDKEDNVTKINLARDLAGVLQFNRLISVARGTVDPNNQAKLINAEITSKGSLERQASIRSDDLGQSLERLRQQINAVIDTIINDSAIKTIFKTLADLGQAFSSLTGVLGPVVNILTTLLVTAGASKLADFTKIFAGRFTGGSKGTFEEVLAQRFKGVDDILDKSKLGPIQLNSIKDNQKNIIGQQTFNEFAQDKKGGKGNSVVVGVAIGGFALGEVLKSNVFKTEKDDAISNVQAGDIVQSSTLIALVGQAITKSGLIGGLLGLGFGIFNLIGTIRENEQRLVAKGIGESKTLEELTIFAKKVDINKNNQEGSLIDELFSNTVSSGTGFSKVTALAGDLNNLGKINKTDQFKIRLSNSSLNINNLPKDEFDKIRSNRIRNDLDGFGTTNTEKVDDLFGTDEDRKRVADQALKRSFTDSELFVSQILQKNRNKDDDKTIKTNDFIEKALGLFQTDFGAENGPNALNNLRRNRSGFIDQFSEKVQELSPNLSKDQAKLVATVEFDRFIKKTEEAKKKISDFMVSFDAFADSLGNNIDKLMGVFKRASEDAQNNAFLLSSVSTSSSDFRNLSFNENQRNIVNSTGTPTAVKQSFDLIENISNIFDQTLTRDLKKSLVVQAGTSFNTEEGPIANDIENFFKDFKIEGNPELQALRGAIAQIQSFNPGSTLKSIVENITNNKGSNEDLVKGFLPNQDKVISLFIENQKKVNEQFNEYNNKFISLSQSGAAASQSIFDLTKQIESLSNTAEDRDFEQSSFEGIFDGSFNERRKASSESSLASLRALSSDFGSTDSFISKFNSSLAERNRTRTEADNLNRTQPGSDATKDAILNAAESQLEFSKIQQEFNNRMNEFNVRISDAAKASDTLKQALQSFKAELISAGNSITQVTQKDFAIGLDTLSQAFAKLQSGGLASLDQFLGNLSPERFKLFEQLLNSAGEVDLGNGVTGKSLLDNLALERGVATLGAIRARNTGESQGVAEANVRKQLQDLQDQQILAAKEERSLREEQKKLLQIQKTNLDTEKKFYEDGITTLKTINALVAQIDAKKLSDIVAATIQSPVEAFSGSSKVKSDQTLTSQDKTAESTASIAKNLGEDMGANMANVSGYLFSIQGIVTDIKTILEKVMGGTITQSVKLEVSPIQVNVALSAPDILKLAGESLYKSIMSKVGPAIAEALGVISEEAKSTFESRIAD